MAMNIKDVKDGYYYVEKDDGYSVVQVTNGYVWGLGYSLSNPKEKFTFIERVPEPDLEAHTQSTLAQLRRDLNLPEKAPVQQVLRAALRLAREAAQKARETP